MLGSAVIARAIKWLAILVAIIGVNAMSAIIAYRYGKAGCELRHAENYARVQRQITESDNRIRSENPSSSSVSAILDRLEGYAVDRQY